MGSESDRSSWLIEPIAKRHDRAAFSYGKEPLDRYLKTQAGQDARRRVAAPFVLVEGAGGTAVLGYYTLSAFGIDLGALPEGTAKRLPRYPIVPATLLGRLAVHRDYGGRGLGEFLLMDALNRALRQSSKIAAAAVVVDAMDEDAWRFYDHFDFIPFPDRSDRLFLPMTVVKLLFT
ncbi:MAG: GNAT family N-acetyltransferase [Kiloniellaceae bacterium]